MFFLIICSRRKHWAPIQYLRETLILSENRQTLNYSLVSEHNILKRTVVLMKGRNC